MKAYPKPSKKKKKLLPLPKLKKKTQTIFNKWIRERDADLTCISCTGKLRQAGHYIAQGSSAFLRFHEDNVNGQCAGCNMFKSGNLIEYRIGLVSKIGIKRVQWLEDHRQDPKTWKRWELEALIERYK